MANQRGRSTFLSQGLISLHHKDQRELRPILYGGASTKATTDTIYVVMIQMMIKEAITNLRLRQKGLFQTMGVAF